MAKTEDFLKEEQRLRLRFNRLLKLSFGYFGLLLLGGALFWVAYPNKIAKLREENKAPPLVYRTPTHGLPFPPHSKRTSVS